MFDTLLQLVQLDWTCLRWKTVDISMLLLDNHSSSSSFPRLFIIRMQANLQTRKLTIYETVFSKAVDVTIMLRYIHLHGTLETVSAKSVQWIDCQSENEQIAEKTLNTTSAARHSMTNVHEQLKFWCNASYLNTLYHGFTYWRYQQFKHCRKIQKLSIEINVIIDVFHCTHWYCWLHREFHIVSRLVTLTKRNGPLFLQPSPFLRLQSISWPNAVTQ